MEFTIPLNKFEKRDLVIKLHKEGKTYREIAHIAHISPRDIKLIIKKYEQQKRLETKKEETNNQMNQKTKKLSLSSQAFTLFKKGKELTEVAIILDIPSRKVSKFWWQFLKLEKKFDCYEFYEIWQNDLSTLLPITNFMKRNNVSGKYIANVLRTANDVINLNQTCYNIKNQVEKLRQIKNNLQYTNNYYLPPLKPLPNPTNWNYY